MARRRRGNSPDKRHALDTRIVQTAAYFTAVLWQPRGESIRREFPGLPEAIAAARAMRDPYGRRALVYAVSASGRDAELSRADWPDWLALWRRLHP